MPTISNLYQRGLHGIALRDGQRYDGYPPIPEATYFGLGANVPRIIRGWAWSDTFSAWVALIEFKEGHPIYDWPTYRYVPTVLPWLIADPMGTGLADDPAFWRWASEVVYIITRIWVIDDLTLVQQHAPWAEGWEDRHDRDSHGMARWLVGAAYAEIGRDEPPLKED